MTFKNKARRHEAWELKQMQSLPLDAKIVKSQLRIKEWYEHWDGNVYVSFSGGKDSTVLLHLVRSVYPNVPAVFADTGLEFPEIKEFVRDTPDVTTIRPTMSFRKVLENYGYPVISKEVSYSVYGARKGWASRLKKFDPNYKSMLNISKWRFLIDAPFKVSDSCCEVMKKRPFRKYEKETQRKPILGTMASESRSRQKHWLRAGCNAFDNNRPVSQPLSFWLEEDIWEYLKTRQVPYSPIYDMGYSRTGCVFCAFGVHLEDEPNRFQRMAETHPNLYRYCMDKLGMSKVLDYINVPYKKKGEYDF